jgi:chemotaxis protein CheY-P-specific phosphatase CheC
MEITKQILQKAADAGSKEVSKAFSKLSGEDVKVTASVAELVSYQFIGDSLQPGNDKAIVTYAQMIGDTEGASILTIPREQTLMLIDLLNKEEVGTTGVLMNIDRSAVKETLNILSNSYLTALSKLSGTKLIIGAPYMMTANNVNSIVDKIKNKGVEDEDSAVVLKTSLEIAKHKVHAQLYIIFNKEFVQLIKDNK